MYSPLFVLFMCTYESYNPRSFIRTSWYLARCCPPPSLSSILSPFFQTTLSLYFTNWIPICLERDWSSYNRVFVPLWVLWWFNLPWFNLNRESWTFKDGDGVLCNGITFILPLDDECNRVENKYEILPYSLYHIIWQISWYKLIIYSIKEVILSKAILIYNMIKVNNYNSGLSKICSSL